ncbi:MAG: hypothetical protein HYV60_18245 [Planctomycetia bacterium]|nr:hypothetical protein [Planctomycetia bacterium]
MTTIDVTKTHVAKELKHESPIISCRFDPTGKYVFFGAQDFKVWRWEWSGEAKVEFNHNAWVRGIAFHPNGETVLTAGYDGRLVWWPVAADKPEPIREVAAHDGWARAVAVSPDGSLVATAGNDHTVKLWNFADGSLVKEFVGHDCHVYNVLFHPDGKSLVSGVSRYGVRRDRHAAGRQRHHQRDECLRGRRQSGDRCLRLGVSHIEDPTRIESEAARRRLGRRVSSRQLCDWHLGRWRRRFSAVLEARRQRGISPSQVPQQRPRSRPRSRWYARCHGTC